MNSWQNATLQSSCSSWIHFLYKIKQNTIYDFRFLNVSGRNTYILQLVNQQRLTWVRFFVVKNTYCFLRLKILEFLTIFGFYSILKMLKKFLQLTISWSSMSPISSSSSSSSSNPENGLKMSKFEPCCICSYLTFSVFSPFFSHFIKLRNSKLLISSFEIASDTDTVSKDIRYLFHAQWAKSTFQKLP